MPTAKGCRFRFGLLRSLCVVFLASTWLAFGRSDDFALTLLLPFGLLTALVFGASARVVGRLGVCVSYFNMVAWFAVAIYWHPLIAFFFRLDGEPEYLRRSTEAAVFGGLFAVLTCAALGNVGKGPVSWKYWTFVSTIGALAIATGWWCKEWPKSAAFGVILVLAQLVLSRVVPPEVIAKAIGGLSPLGDSSRRVAGVSDDSSSESRN